MSRNQRQLWMSLIWKIQILKTETHFHQFHSMFWSDNSCASTTVLCRLQRLKCVSVKVTTLNYQGMRVGGCKKSEITSKWSKGELFKPDLQDFRTLVLRGYNKDGENAQVGAKSISPLCCFHLSYDLLLWNKNQQKPCAHSCGAGFHLFFKAKRPFRGGKALPGTKWLQDYLGPSCRWGFACSIQSQKLKNKNTQPSLCMRSGC